MTEQWKTISGYEGLYEVSDEGHVRRLPSRYVPAGHLLKATIRVNEYPKLSLCREGTTATAYIHILVATAFLGPRPDGTEVRHLDGDAFNNRATNLRWGTHSQNMLDAVVHGTHNNARKVECKNHHPLAGNVYLKRSPTGIRRSCKTCHARWNSRAAARRKLRPVQLTFREPQTLTVPIAL